MKGLKKFPLRLLGAVISGLLIIGAVFPAFAAADVSIAVKAVDEDENPVAGALFEMIGTGDSEGTNFSSTLSGQDGISTFSNLPENGTFKIVQKSAPERYTFYRENERYFKIVNGVVKILNYGDEEENYSNAQPAEWMNSDYYPLTYTIPVVIETKQTGEKAPGKQTFKIQFADSSIVENNFIRIINDTVETNGVGKFTGEFKFTIPSSHWVRLSDSGAFISQVDEKADGWTYSSSKYHIMLYRFDIISSGDNDSQVSVDIHPVVEGNGEGFELGERVEAAAFVNSYNKVKDPDPIVTPPTTKTEENNQTKSPQTGCRTAEVYFAVLFAAVGALGALAILKRREA